jgi:hypothetical protein
MIVGFNLTKIAVDRLKPVTGKIKVSHDLRLEKVTKRPLPMKEQQDALVFDFVFELKYEPAVGSVILGGNVLYLHPDAKKTEETYAIWEKKKKITPEVSVEVLNTIFSRCNVKALELSHTLGLPSHLPMPKIDLKEDPRQYIG